MRHKRNPAAGEEAQLIRLAWFAAFFATVALIAILGLARSAQAMTIPVTGPATALALVEPEEGEEQFEGGDEGDEEELDAECESEDETEEEECVAELEEEESAEAPRECVLSSAAATVSTATNSDKVRLAIHYTAYAPSSIEVVYWLRGSKGPLNLGTIHSHLGKQGVIRDVDTLVGAQTTKAQAAKTFTIQLRPAHAPSYCNQLLDRHLTTRHDASGRLTWSDPDSTLATSR
jgi:hypothetical protein